MTRSAWLIAFALGAAWAQDPAATTGVTAPGGFEETDAPRVELLPAESAPDGPPGQDETGPAPVDPLIENLNRVLDRDAADAGTAGDAPPPSDGATASPQGLFYIVQVTGALALVFALLVLFRYFGLKWSKNAPMLTGGQLGQVLGRIHLGKGGSLFFVRTAGRVLVVGSTNASMTVLADFDADLFSPQEASGAASDPGLFSRENFLAQLRASAESARPLERVADDDIASLRGDLARLQQYIQEESRDPKL